MSAISKIIFIMVLFGAGLMGIIQAQDDSENEKTPDDKPADATESIEGPLVYSDDWNALSKINTPLPVITEINYNNNHVTLPNPENAKGFLCVAEPSQARFDTDGDDEYDTDVKRKEEFIKFKIKYPNELQMSYKLRVFISGKTQTGGQSGAITWSSLWSYQRACFMTAKTSLGTFTLIDDNTNGYYGDYGKDAIVVGASKDAEPLSSIIIIKGKFYKLKVETLAEVSAAQRKDPKFTGMVLNLTPFEAESGKLDMIKNLKSPKGPPRAIIVRRGDDAFFQLAGGGKSAVVLPVGEYHLVSAVFTPRVRARTSEKPIAIVEAGQTAAPKWGAPFKLEMSAFAEKGGTEIIVIPPGELKPPEDVSKNLDCPFIKTDFPKILGSLGEEYYAPDEFKDERGYALPDEGITSFNVDIRPKGAPANEKPLNKRGNPFTDRWIQTDMSGLVQKSVPYWATYRCPIEKYRGTVVFKVWVKSKFFGDLAFEKEIEVTE